MYKPTPSQRREIVAAVNLVKHKLGMSHSTSQLWADCLKSVRADNRRHVSSGWSNWTAFEMEARMMSWFAQGFGKSDMPAHELFGLRADALPLILAGAHIQRLKGHSQSLDLNEVDCVVSGLIAHNEAIKADIASIAA